MTLIESITKEQMKDLISSGEWGKLSDDEIEKVETVLRDTSLMWAGFIDGELICVYGIAPPSFLSNRAYFWLWHTDRVKDHEFIFVRRSQIVVKELLKEYETLVGHCRIGAEQSARWLRWLGATFGEPDGNFIPFEIRRA